MERESDKSPRLTLDDVQAIRHRLVGIKSAWTGFGSDKWADQVHALCDMALSSLSHVAAAECRGFLPGADPEKCAWCGVKIAQHSRPSSIGTPNVDMVRFAASAIEPRTFAALHACEGLDTADLIGNTKGWLAEVVHAAARVEAKMNSALRACCAGNTEDDEPVRCQSYEASEQAAPCPRGQCVMAEPTYPHYNAFCWKCGAAAKRRATSDGSTNG